MPTLETSDEDEVDAEDEDEIASASEALAKRISETVESCGLAEELTLQREAKCVDRAEVECLLYTTD